MTRADLLTALARRTNKNTTLDTATQNRLLDFLNERQRRVLSMPGMSRLRRATYDFTSAADRATYTLRRAARILGIRDTTNDRVLAEMDVATYRDVAPDPSLTTGTPTHFVWLHGATSMNLQPTDASAVYVKSSSAADTTQTVYVEGAVTGNFPYSTSAALNGTTAVQVGSGVSTWIRIDRWYVSAVTAGFVALYEDSGSGTEMASLGPGQLSARYMGIALYPTPSGTVSYTADIERAIGTLDQSNEEPDLPEDFHDLLLLGALMDEYQHMNDERYAVAASEYRARERQFKYWLAGTGMGESGGPWEAPSRLGPWFPSGV